MKQHGTYLVPTLYLLDWFPEQFHGTGLDAERGGQGEGGDGRRRARTSGAAMHEGVKVAFGTDAAVYPHGLNAHEFAAMVQAAG